MADNKALEEKDREIAALRSQLDQETGRLNRLVEISGALNSTLKLDELLELIMSSATELLNAETSSLFLVDEEAGELTVEVATGESGAAVKQHRVPIGTGIAGWVVDNGEPLVVDSPRDDSRFYGEIDSKTGFETRDILAVPMRTKERTIGAIEVINRRDGGLGDKDVSIASALANQAAVAIENTRLYARLADGIVASRLSYRL